jgi:hypothetical protein
MVSYDVISHVHMLLPSLTILIRLSSEDLYILRDIMLRRMKGSDY